MTLRKFLHITVMLLLSCAVRTSAQSRCHSMPFVLMEYNCENLFDCRHDSLKEDLSFLPEGKHRWTFSRYWRKVNDIAKVIHQCGGTYANRHIPDVVAMTEVENDSVMYMLAHGSMLREAGYRFVITNSPDIRGVDVALLYNPLTFRLLNHYPLRMTPMKGQRPTRDILYVEGTVRSNDTIHIFVVHAPSRGEGAYASEPYRMAVAQRLEEAADSVRAKHADANIIMAGDFNDYHYNKSLKLLGKAGMTNVSAKARGRIATGTYKYGGRWMSLDHILLSAPLLDKVRECRIHDPSWLLQVDKAGGMKPRRTFLGTFYNGGVSDHLPLLVRMEFEYR